MLRIFDLTSSFTQEDEKDDQGEDDKGDSTDGSSDDGSRIGTGTRARTATKRCRKKSALAWHIANEPEEAHLPLPELLSGRPPPPPTPEMVGSAAPGAREEGELSEIHPEPPAPTVKIGVL